MRARPALVALLFVVLPPATVDAAGVSASGGDGATEVDGETTTTFAENPFLPEDRNLGDCVSSMPRPDCGSKAHGGWRQGIVFIILMLGMAFIGWRIFRAVRRADRQIPDHQA